MRKSHLKQFTNVSSIFVSDLYIMKLGNNVERESGRNTERLPNPTHDNSENKNEGGADKFVNGKLCETQPHGSQAVALDRLTPAVGCGDPDDETKRREDTRDRSHRFISRNFGWQE